MKRIMFLLLLTSVFASCSKSDDLDGLKESKFKVNTEYTLDGDDKFYIRSIQDSRCPSNAVCIWEGEVNLELEIISSAGSEKFKLKYKNDGTIQKFSNKQGYDFTIKSIDPYPVLPVTTTQEDYVVDMEVKKIF